MRGLVPSWVLRHSFLSLTDCWWLYNIQLKTSRGYSFCPLLMLCQKLSLSPLYFNKSLLHKSSERSSLVSGPGLNSPQEAKNPGVFSWFSNNLSSWWWTGRPRVLPFMGSQRVGHDRVTELNWRYNKYHPHFTNKKTEKQRKQLTQGFRANKL